MSETATEDTGATGEVVAPESTADPSQGHEEDQTAEEQLHKVMQEQDPDELAKQVEHWKQMARRHEKTARSNSAAAAKLREYEDSQKSDLQKAEDARNAAIEERDALITSQNRMLAAAAKNLSPEWIDYLGNGTADEINDKAEQLDKLIEAEVTKRIASRTGGQEQGNGGRSRTGRPTEQLAGMRPGAAPSDTSSMTGDQLFRQLIQGDRD
jgi:hypothetical protein